MTAKLKYKCVIAVALLSSYTSFASAGNAAHIEELALEVAADQAAHSSSNAAKPAGGTGEPKAYEMPRTQVVPIQDSNTGRRYEIYIQLPEDYWENTDKQYPVIYMTDGEVQMSLLSGTTEFLMPEVISVGISWQKDDNGNDVPGSRLRDYTIIEYEAVDRPTGEAGKYLSFLRDAVIAHVEKNYRVKPGERAYLGYSSGGELGAYILLARPDTFKYYLLGSPALDELSTQYLVELAADNAPQQSNLNAFAFVSIAEHERPGRLELTGRFMSVLERRSEAGLGLAGLKIIEDSDHTSAVPETFVRGIKWLSQQIRN